MLLICSAINCKAANDKDSLNKAHNADQLSFAHSVVPPQNDADGQQPNRACRRCICGMPCCPLMPHVYPLAWHHCSGSCQANNHQLNLSWWPLHHAWAMCCIATVRLTQLPVLL